MDLVRMLNIIALANDIHPIRQKSMIDAIHAIRTTRLKQSGSLVLIVEMHTSAGKARELKQALFTQPVKRVLSRVFAFIQGNEDQCHLVSSLDLTSSTSSYRQTPRQNLL